LSVISIMGFSVGCGRTQQTNMSVLDAAGVSPDAIDQLRRLGMSGQEIQQVSIVYHGGMDRQSCISLVKIAHQQHEAFTYGSAAAGLLAAGMKQESVLELARLDQLRTWAGEAQALRLAEVPDEVILELAKRRASGQPTVSGPKIAKLRNLGAPARELLDDIRAGLTDSRADQLIAWRSRSSQRQGFVRQIGRRR
jgi:hypothetical protein